MNLTPEQLAKCAFLLEIIVRPGEHSFGSAIEEAQKIFGYTQQPKPNPKFTTKRRMRRKRAFNRHANQQTEKQTEEKI